jgi:hypothetical protein
MRKLSLFLVVALMMIGCSLDRTIDEPAKLVEVPVIVKADSTNINWVVQPEIVSLVSSTTNYVCPVPPKRYLWKISDLTNFLVQMHQWYEVYDGDGVLKATWLSNIVTLSDTNHTFVWYVTNSVKP